MINQISTEWDLPLGSWVVKVDNDEVWNEYVKTGKVKGFSIEGYFADKAEAKKITEEEMNQKIVETLKNIISNE